MTPDLEVVWDGTQKHPVTGSRGGLTTYPTREHGTRDLPAMAVEPTATPMRNRLGHPGIEIGERMGRLVLDAIAAGNSTSSSLAAYLGISRRLANHYLLRLTTAGLVRQQRGGLTGRGFKAWRYEVVAQR